MSNPVDVMLSDQVIVHLMNISLLMFLGFIGAQFLKRGLSPMKRNQQPADPPKEKELYKILDNEDLKAFVTDTKKLLELKLKERGIDIEDVEFYILFVVGALFLMMLVYMLVLVEGGL